MAGRERWASSSAFIIATIGSAIGLGNVWRFPYMVYKNGGGAFFIPYLIALFTAGIPILMLEYYVGTHFQRGPVKAMAKIRPSFSAIGWMGLSFAFIITTYYAVIMSWVLNYLWHSLSVSWAGNEAAFFQSTVLNLSSEISLGGELHLPVALCTILVWISIYMIISRGIGFVGKIVKWTVGVPWIFLIILIIRGLSLENSMAGISYYLTPNFDSLLNPQVWLDAYGQIFFSLSLGFGIVIAYASYLPSKKDIAKNSWIIGLSNSLTSFFAGFAVFSILGFLVGQTGQDIGEVAKEGPGLAFVIYPTAIAVLPGGIALQSIFALLFFSMLLLLGIDSAFSLSEGVATGFSDFIKGHRKKICAVLCTVSCAVGLVFCTRSGLYWLDIVDHWMNWGLVIVGFLEVTVIAWFLGGDKVMKDIRQHSRYSMGGVLVFLIRYWTPLVLLVILATNVINELKDPYGDYPTWALFLGGWLPFLGVIVISYLLSQRKLFFAASKKASPSLERQ